MTGRGGTILQTTDGGTTWLPQTTRTWYDISSVCFVDENVGWVSGDYGAIMTTEDGGGVTATKTCPLRLAKSFRLHQNYPNPFNPVTNFRFHISEFGLVSFKIYDALGREVAILMNEQKPAGEYQVRWDASGFPSGVYFYRLRAGVADGGFDQIKKMVLIK